jgi:diguanylate cyclase (GGDEF)-like protein
MQVLIAEDDQVSRKMLVSIVRKWGYQPLAVDDGRQAWEALQQADAPRLVLLDWIMPGWDGIEVVRKLRACETVDPPYVILLTSKGDSISLVEGLEAGANDYIRKPYDPHELRARLGVGKRMLDLQEALRTERDARAHEAMHDPLTGALNRRAIHAELARETARAHRERTDFCIGVADIDHFKSINDTHGHQTGDEVLIGLVQLFRRQIRPYDTLGRWGGEEFILMTPGPMPLVAQVVYERLRTACMATPISTHIGTISLTISLGVAVWNGQESDDALLAAADAALYAAKRQGRNRICIAAPRPITEVHVCTY